MTVPTPCTFIHMPPVVLPLHTHEIVVYHNESDGIHVFTQIKCPQSEGGERVRDGLFITVNLVSGVTTVQICKDGVAASAIFTLKFGLGDNASNCPKVRLDDTHEMLVKHYEHGIDVWCVLLNGTSDGWDIRGEFSGNCCGVSFMNNGVIDGSAWRASEKEGQTFVDHYDKGVFISSTIFYKNGTKTIQTICKGSLGEERNSHDVHYDFDSAGSHFNTVIGLYHMK